MLLRALTFSVTYLGAFLWTVNASAITLEQATYTAIDHSPTVRQAIAKYREAIQATDISKHSGFYPSLDFSSGIGKETTYYSSGVEEDTTLTRREMALTLTQPLFDGFSSTHDVDRLTDTQESDRWQALVSVENTALDVAKSYADVLRYRELFSLSEKNLETHKRIFNQIKLKSDTGVGRQSDLSQITARLAKAYANRYAAENNLRDAESNYQNVVGELPPQDMIYPVPDSSLLPKSLDAAIDQSLAKNPSIIGSKFDVDATINRKKIAESNRYPTINFVVERSWNRNIDGAVGPDEDLQAMLRLNYNLYNGGNDKRNIQSAVEQNIQAMEIRRQTMRDTELTVRLAWAAYEATTNQKDHIKEYVVATKESQVAYEKQFRLGRRTLLDVLDSENELFQARQDYVNADYDELFSEFRLFNAKGELMRALRIYRPAVLGFKDEFDESTPTAKTKSPSEELKSVEANIQTEPSTPATNSTEQTKSNSTTTPSSTTTDKNLEDKLFIDSNGQSSGGWQ